MFCNLAQFDRRAITGQHQVRLKPVKILPCSVCADENECALSVIIEFANFGSY